MIKIKNLTFRYAKHKEPILQDINFNFEKNKVYAILGINGSGKTTLLNLLNGFLEPDKGSQIFLQDQLLKNIKHKDRAKIFCYVPQKIDLFFKDTVEQYLAFSFLHNKKIFENKITDEEQAKIKDVLEKFNILDLHNKPMDHLSGGQRQMVAFCAAILQDANILFLDEPMSAMDLSNQSKVLQVINTLENKTVVFTTHNPNHALKLNCEVLLLNDKNIEMSGQAKEVIKIENLKHIFGEEIKNSKDLDYSEITI